MPDRPKVYLRSYPIPDGMEAHAAAVEEDGLDGMFFTDTQNLSMDVFGSLYLAASATSRLALGTVVTNLVTSHPAVIASSPAKSCRRCRRSSCRPDRPDLLQGLRRLMGKEQFSYGITKNGKVFVYWHGTQGKRENVLEGARAASLIRDLPTMNPEERQPALARATGNFKRGNERQSGNV